MKHMEGRYTQEATGPTNIKLPAIGFPSPTSIAKSLMLKFAIDVVGVTTVCSSNPLG